MQLLQYQTIAGPIFGTCHHETQLAAKFAIWARQFGVSDRDSLAYLVCDKPEKWPLYFNDEISMLRHAAECERRLAIADKPEDFGVAIPSGELCFDVMDITLN